MMFDFLRKTKRLHILCCSLIFFAFLGKAVPLNADPNLSDQENIKEGNILSQKGKHQEAWDLYFKDLQSGADPKRKAWLTNYVQKYKIVVESSNNKPSSNSPSLPEGFPPLSGFEQKISLNVLPSLGQITKYHVEITQNISTNVPDIPQQEIKNKAVISQKVQEVRKDGSRLIVASYADQLQKKDVTYLLSKNGKVSLLEGKDPGFYADNLFIALPPGPVKIGDSWKANHALKIPNAGRVDIQTQYTLTAIQKGFATLQIITSVADFQDLGLDIEYLRCPGTGTIIYDYEKAEMVQGNIKNDLEIRDKNGQTVRISTEMKIIRDKQKES